MLAVQYTTIQNEPERLENFCKMAGDRDETVIITRENENNVVMISLEQYNTMAKAVRNLEYLNKINRGWEQIENGECQEHDIIEVDSNE